MAMLLEKALPTAVWALKEHQLNTAHDTHTHIPFIPSCRTAVAHSAAWYSLAVPLIHARHSIPRCAPLLMHSPAVRPPSQTINPSSMLCTLVLHHALYASACIPIPGPGGGAVVGGQPPILAHTCPHTRAITCTYTSTHARVHALPRTGTPCLRTSRKATPRSCPRMPPCHGRVPCMTTSLTGPLQREWSRIGWRGCRGALVPKFSPCRSSGAQKELWCILFWEESGQGRGRCLWPPGCSSPVKRARACRGCVRLSGKHAASVVAARCTQCLLLKAGSAGIKVVGGRPPWYFLMQLLSGLRTRLSYAGPKVCPVPQHPIRVVRSILLATPVPPLQLPSCTWQHGSKMPPLPLPLCRWQPWSKLVNMDPIPPETPFRKIIIPSIDTVR